MAESSVAAWSRRYVLYVIVAAVVGVITVALREFVGSLLPRDTPVFYAVSVVVAYGCGVVLNYALQSRFTFGAAGGVNSPGRFFAFAITAICSSLLTVALSYLLRYRLGLGELFGAWGSMAAFCAAAVMVSIVSYSINARYVFGNGRRRR
jgi:putative flippase GtrA